MDMMEEITLLVEKTVKDELLQKDFAEVAMRRANAQFKSMVKCPILGEGVKGTNNPDLIAKAVLKMNAPAVESVRGMLGKVDLSNKAITDEVKNLSFKIGEVFSSPLQKITKLNTGLSFLNSVVSLADLAVNIVGFKIISEKLNKTNEKLVKLESDIEILINNEKVKLRTKYNEIVRSVNDYTDRIEDNENMPLEKFGDFISSLCGFIEALIEDISYNTFDNSFLLEMLYTLMPAYSFMLDTYLKQYYFEKNKFPTNYTHGAYTNVFDRILALNKNNRFFDYLVLEKDVHIIDAIDIVNVQNLLAIEYKTQIQDRAKLFETFHSEKELCDFEKELKQIALKDIKQKIPEIIKANSDIDEKECGKFIESLESQAKIC